VKGFIIFTYLTIKLIEAASLVYLITRFIQKAGGDTFLWVAFAIYLATMIVSIPLAVAIRLMEGN